MGEDEEEDVSGTEKDLDVKRECKFHQIFTEAQKKQGEWIWPNIYLFIIIYLVYYIAVKYVIISQ